MLAFLSDETASERFNHCQNYPTLWCSESLIVCSDRFSGCLFHSHVCGIRPYIILISIIVLFFKSINHLFVKTSKMTVTKVSVQDQQGSESAYSDPKMRQYS